jgi:hypothetical protein
VKNVVFWDVTPCIFGRITRHHIPEEGILHSERCENLKSYNDRVFENRVLRRIFGPKKDDVNAREKDTA